MDYEEYRKKQLENPEPGIEEGDWLDYFPNIRELGSLLRHGLREGGKQATKVIVSKAPKKAAAMLIRKLKFPTQEQDISGLGPAQKLQRKVKAQELVDIFSKKK